MGRMCNCTRRPAGLDVLLVIVMAVRTYLVLLVIVMAVRTYLHNHFFAEKGKADKHCKDQLNQKMESISAGSP